MADNTALSAPVGSGDTIRDVQKGGASGPKTSVGIIDIGGAGAENLLVAGQKTMANSVPVVLASDQTAVPISAASLPLPAGAATETTLGTRLSESDFDTKTGALLETAPATDTASSGLNGRLQRIAQRLTTLIGLLPAALVGGRLDVNLGAAPATVTANATLQTGTARAGALRLVQGVLSDDSANALTVKTAFARPATSGNNAFVAAVGGKKIRVLGYRLQASGTVQVKFTDTAGTPVDLSQLWEFQAREGAVATAQAGAFEFESGVGLGVQVNLSAAVACNVSVQYVEV